jgi:hypothetical protein
VEWGACFPPNYAICAAGYLYENCNLGNPRHRTLLYWMGWLKVNLTVDETDGIVKI